MNKYLWSECSIEDWPVIKTCIAKSYPDAVEKIVNKYGERFDDDSIFNMNDDWETFREYMNENYNLALSDLEDFDEL